jgi:hypothetical protein
MHGATRKFQTKVVENTHFMFNNLPPPPKKNLMVNEKKWKNTVQPGWPQMTKWRMCIACWISKATHTPSEYVTLTAFVREEGLRERASMLRYTYNDCLVLF